MQPVIKVEDIAHVRFAAPDLGAMRGFLEDFGLDCFAEGGRLYGRGADGRPFVHVTEPGKARFVALGLRAELLPQWYDVDTAAELARLAECLRAAPPEVAPHTRAFLQALGQGVGKREG